jgi:hypothetical protein
MREPQSCANSFVVAGLCVVVVAGLSFVVMAGLSFVVMAGLDPAISCRKR